MTEQPEVLETTTENLIRDFRDRIRKMHDDDPPQFYMNIAIDLVSWFAAWRTKSFVKQTFYAYYKPVTRWEKITLWVASTSIAGVVGKTARDYVWSFYKTGDKEIRLKVRHVRKPRKNRMYSSREDEARQEE
jgi:hypothetical protein